MDSSTRRSALARWLAALSLSLLSTSSNSARADEPQATAVADGVPIVPATRDDLKRALEASKQSEPRLPMPPATAEDEARARAGDPWALAHNLRMRRHYLPAGVLMGGFSREPDPKMSLGYPFQTRLFWLVSRANNCTYCMGHQESKLAAVGLADDEIAALDSDWATFDPAERAAFAFTRKLTFEPHAISDADLDTLRRAGYTDDQILEIITVVGNFNAMNRWTGALRIPQEAHREYLTPTSEPFRGLASRIAPLPAGSAANDAPTCAAPAQRPQLESRVEVEAALEACRTREPRIPLVSEAEARAALPEGVSDAEGPPPNWVRLLARFPVAGPARVAMHRAAGTDGSLDPRYKVVIAYVAARHDRAWYALALAEQQLRTLEFNDDQIAAIDELANAHPLSTEERVRLAATADGKENSQEMRDRLVAAFARKLTVDPALIGDSDIESLRACFDDKQTAEIVFHVTEAAFFDRLTEAAGLPLEPESSTR